MVVHWEGGLVMCGCALGGGLSDVWLCTGRGGLVMCGCALGGGLSDVW